MISLKGSCRSLSTCLGVCNNTAFSSVLIRKSSGHGSDCERSRLAGEVSGHGIVPIEPVTEHHRPAPVGYGYCSLHD